MLTDQQTNALIYTLVALAIALNYPVATLIGALMMIGGLYSVFLMFQALWC